ncbi:hypothetical protein [Thermomonospora curvata]|uniref:Uncharacterized protein n=1 Tax=Thermomonospora curvata (strain ATCC 19995 / DSM 43183 / JCM 3096 / KCTC 9072 / NBRC 15933 / NCIMB 10081 / Henssen B9) TaxID=471852 RepID=D1AF39_THECD|nr:hypothetical protein [Thermomonospora curvata]ACY99583.1 hypothetical protein Tcur_4054 [Thermomonospora curvata DSM 43183]
MPRGTYLHLSGEEPLEEHFECAPGPGGWRYVGERPDGARVDLTVDGRWRQIRVELATPSWLIRGGTAGHDLLWVRHPAAGDAAPDEHGVRAAGFLGDSPAFLVAVARWLRLEPGRDAPVRLVRIQGPSLAALTVDVRWHLAEIETHQTETVPLPVERHEITDLSTGETRTVHLAGDVVLAAPGIELTDLDSPPNLSP